MADSAAFELACEALEQDTTLDRLEARGTVRIALKAAGLDAGTVTPVQMAVVAANVLPGELAKRGIADGDAACASLRSKLATMETSADAPDTPEAVFARLGGG